MQRYKLHIAYDGKPYSGWQIQPNAPSIQQTIENALTTLLKKPTAVHGSGRTDAGVHAHKQVAHFDAPLLDTFRIKRSLNGLLPATIRILTLEKTDPDFHARFSAKGKIYHYHLHLDPVLNPFKNGYCYHVRAPFNYPLLTQGIPYFIGTKDFAAFTNQSAIQNRTSIRTIYRLDPIPEPGGLRLEFEGNGFLYKMVRNIVGTLLDIAADKLKPAEIPKIMETRDRRSAGRAAPAHALFLHEVLY
ncbi:MAG: tRNA pseudouridine(38-40) synthase TruA [Candidatus Algichlamydia australiensis]|nr:tRNA pseudouridine(38-40) synthase TruA [Chlamydiales bacterium]